MEDYIFNFQKLREAGKEMGLEGADLSGFVQGGMKPTDGDWFGQLINLFRDPVHRKETLEDALKYQKEQMKEAGKYKALFDLPSIVAQAAYAPAAIRARGTEQAANIIGQNIGNMRMGQINPQVPLYGSVNYFG